jgi:pimeloyl-ACP methyl ester carboxylesterase
MPDQIQIRIHGDETGRPLVYLPGLHGNWTLIAGFRKALAGRVRFVELSYPPTLTWSMEAYAAAVESTLAEHDIREGWLLAESFSSQVAWRVLARGLFAAKGLILAGGFVRHPAQWGARLAERVIGDAPLSAITRVLFGYAKVSRLRFRRSSETTAGIHEFVACFTEEQRQAATHRLRLVAESDPRPIARQVRVPIYALTGVLDPIVPWPWVRHWLKKNCPALKDYKICWRADHNVLGTAPGQAANQIIRWMNRGAG